MLSGLDAHRAVVGIVGEKSCVVMLDEVNDFELGVGFFF